MEVYYKYFKYIVKHKILVFKECWKDGLYVHAFTHDLSKFRPSEFFPYAEWFYGKYGKLLIENYNKCSLDIKKEILTNDNTEISKAFLSTRRNFQKAWRLHYKRNKHHWNHWCYNWNEYKNINSDIEDYKLDIPYFMNDKYIRQMICDWKAMGKAFNNTVQEYYIKNYQKIILHHETRLKLEYELGINLIGVYNNNTLYEQCMKMDEHAFNNYFYELGDVYFIKNAYKSIKYGVDKRE